MQGLISSPRLVIVSAPWVATLRYRDTFGVARTVCAAQLRDEPTVGSDVVLDDGIACVAAGAGTAKGLPERAQRYRTRDKVAALVENR
jgi:hypothetical protein